MRKVIFATPNRVEIDSGHREFDMSIGALRPGNTIDSGYHSSYIRAFNTPATPGGTPCAPGQMQEVDLKGFGNLPQEVRDYLDAAAQDESVILYEIRHRSSRRNQWGERIIVRHGYIATRIHPGYELLRKFYCGPTKKSSMSAPSTSRIRSGPLPRHGCVSRCSPRSRDSSAAWRWD